MRAVVMAAAAVKNSTKHLSITVNVYLKRSKEEMMFVEKEAERLHKLIESEKQIDWAKDRMAVLHKLVLSPTEDIKREVIAKLKDGDVRDQLGADEVKVEDPSDKE
jgi:hypothetical protein